MDLTNSAAATAFDDSRQSEKQTEWLRDLRALGEMNQLIACRLGVSRTRVSQVLHSALRQLGLRNRARLVYCVRGLGLPGAYRRAGADLPDRARRRATGAANRRLWSRHD